MNCKNQELENARKLEREATEVKERFLELISHELRTPVNPILGTVGLLEEKHVDDLESIEHLAVVRNSAQHLLNMIDQILDISSMDRGENICSPHWSSMERVFDDLETLFGLQAEKKHLQFVLPEWPIGPFEFFVDDRRVGQVLIELVSNAIRFSECGKVEVAASINCKDDHATGGCFLHIDVIDEGIGMSMELESHLRDAFTQADDNRTRKYDGLGLGLAIVTKLVTSMGGRLSIRSGRGEGTTVSVFLELQRREKENVVQQSLAISNDTLNRQLRILLAEDDLFNQRIAAAILRKMGAEVTVAGDGQIALDKCTKSRFDVIVMDVSMPYMDRIEATRRIRESENCKNIPIIALTAHTSRKTEQQCREAGMIDFLTKPIDRERVLQAIHQLTET